MATVTGFTSARMEAMEAATIVSGAIVGDDLILTKHDASTVNAGNVRGDTGSPGISAGDLDDYLSDHFPIGISLEYIGTVSPSAKWLLENGQTIVGGDVLYPTFWARIPASMKSGSDIIMCDSRKRVTVGYDVSDSDFNAIAKIGGAKTHILTTAELAAHTHLQSAHTHLQNAHNHTQSAHYHTNAAHNHTQAAHYHGSPPHTHDITQTYISTPRGGSSGVNTITAGGDTPFTVSSYGVTTEAATASNYETSITINEATAVNVQQTAVNQDTTAVNQNAGSGSAHNNLQPYIVKTKIIKVL